MSTLKRVTRYLCAAVYVLAGINHFWHAAFYVSIMPPYLPWHLALVYISGVAEIVLGAALLVRTWSPLAAWGIVALLIAVFPANLHMALHPELFPWASPVSLWVRIPIQGVLILWALWYTRPERSVAAAEAS